MLRSRPSYLRLILPFLIGFALLRLIFWLGAFPNPDEAYYWLWGQRPGWSYYDHPPLLAWVQGFFSTILGRSPFVLRLPNLFSNAALFYLYYRICRSLYGSQAMLCFWLTIALLLASPLYFLFLALAWHDHVLITLALLSSVCFITFLETYWQDGQGDSRWLYGTGIALGLAALCKYSAVFVGIGFVLALILDKRSRPLLRDRRLYLTGAIALCAVIPILIWNLSNDWQSFRYYVNRSVNTGGFSLKFTETLGFIVFSILMLSPWIAIALVKLLRHPRRLLQHHPIYGTVALAIFAVSTLTLVGVSLISTALYYWNILAYLLLFPLLVPLFLRSAPSDPDFPSLSPIQIKRGFFLGSQIYGLLFAALLVIHYAILPISALVSPDADPDSRMLFGWEEVAAAVQQQIATLENPVLITTDYRSASALAYQLNQSDVIAISDRVDQFDFWYPDHSSLVGRNAILLSDDWHPLTPTFRDRFAQTSSPLTIPIRRFGIWIKTYSLIRNDARN